MLVTQVVIAKGIRLLLRLAQDRRQLVSATARSTLEHLGAISWRLKSIMLNSNSDGSVLATTAEGEAPASLQR